jgi:propanediol dehydratase small subunit
MAIRQLTADDILDFHASRKRGAQYLAIENGEFAYLDDSHIASGTPLSYNYVTTHQDTEAQILLTQDTILEGDWFPLDDDGRLTPETAAEMADSINDDARITLAMAVERAHELAVVAEEDAAKAQASALARAAGVARVVSLCGGNQREAARRLGIDQSRVSRLVAKAGNATEAIADASEALTVAMTAHGMPAHMKAQSMAAAIKALGQTLEETSSAVKMATGALAEDSQRSEAADIVNVFGAGDADATAHMSSSWDALDE